MEISNPAVIRFVSHLIEIAGLAVIVGGGLFAIARFIINVRQHLRPYPTFRRDLGRSILLGLEFLVAGDIISTITIEPTLTSVSVLGLIVLIRTFLSFSLEVEINGRWPWQPDAKPKQERNLTDSEGQAVL
jgi:uncharacterized membrane protein